MRTRRNVYDIENDPGDDTLTWYGKAIGEMKSRPISAHDSWRFQAAVHDYSRATDPLAVPGETLPSAADQQRYWAQCQHGSWFFIPWHRMFLHHFERIVMAAVESLGGPSDWALPYWNYSKDAASRLLPPSFRSPQLADGSPNHLYVSQRRPIANAGQPFADEADVALDACLTASPFTGAPTGNPGFGGGASGFVHSGAAPGRLEIIPHGSMHGAVGGPGGFMSYFNTAGLDPIFWLHHSNIDRLWEVWRARDAAHTDPALAQWTNGVRFPFRAADGTDDVMTCSQVVDPQAAPLDYVYDDISDPLPQTFGIAAGAQDVAGIPQLIGATDQPLDVHHAIGATHCVVRAPRSRGAVESFGIDSAPEHIYLQLEHLTGDSGGAAIDVYLGLPKDADPANHLDRRVGRIPLFGLREASDASGPHAGSGLTFSLDVTAAFETLADGGDADYRDVPITLHPVGEQGEHRVRVGRISLYAE